MADKEVTVYISDNCKECEALIKQLEEWDIAYNKINVTKEQKKMDRLQSMDIYGTPALFVKGRKLPVLGFQKNKLKDVLNIMN
ncbi:glutaredoxin family protein [Virgibacillus sp. W0430]|uniref:glutaredoxin family protein n=1 Tax=Virgibacillus sp. W0430 TaxID=3391580 RepID=UPI003F48DFBC